MRLAGCPPAKRAGAGIASADHVDELGGRLDRRAARASRTIARAIWRGVALLAVLAQHARQAALVPLVDELGARSSSCAGSMRMSSGAS